MELYSQYKDKNLNKYNSVIFNILKTLGISYKTNGASYIRIIVLSEIKKESEILNLNSYYTAIAKKYAKSVASVKQAVNDCIYNSSKKYEDNYSSIFNFDFNDKYKSSKNLIEDLICYLINN